MPKQLAIDCKGMKCPRPIIEIAKASRKLTPGSHLKVQADDLAFESDVKAWAENTNSTIIDFNRNGNQVEVLIKLH
ncbi:sulfurtransferase TusA family protein [candidate division KSB1 bacterium]